jgi:hypothetical protein
MVNTVKASTLIWIFLLIEKAFSFLDNVFAIPSAGGMPIANAVFPPMIFRANEDICSDIIYIEPRVPIRDSIVEPIPNPLCNVYTNPASSQKSQRS